MYKDKHILCVIPARGGSKRLPGKNIMPFLGMPLISYAIRAAKASKYIDRVVVSTDNEEIAKVAKEQGAEIPFMRPTELSGDDISALPVIQHAVSKVEKAGDKVDAIALVQPTVPSVLAHDIDATIERLFLKGVNSCITVTPIIDPPEWMYRMKEDGMLEKYISTIENRSQFVEKLYRANGAVYTMRRETLMDDNKITDTQDCISVLMPRERSIDIDTQADFDMAEMLLTKQK